MISDKTKGVLVVLAASMMWAIEPVLAKLSYRTTDVANTFAMRAVFCLVTILAYVLVRRIDLRVGKRQVAGLVYISLAATLFADLMYIYALSKIPVINAVLIGHMQPVFIVVMGYLLLKTDRITRFDYLGMLFMIIAGLLVTSRNLDNLVRLRIGTAGDLYVLLATIAWASTAIIARKYLIALPAAVIAFYRFLFATVVFVAFLTLRGAVEAANIYEIFLGIVIGAGTILYYEGIRLIKAAQVSALELSTPFFATIIGFVVLKEYVTAVQLCGFAFLAAGMFFLSRKES